MKRIISTLLSVLMIMSGFTMALGTTAAAANEWVEVDMSYEDSLETFNRNPGRGKSGGRWYILGKDNLPTDFSSSGGVVTPKFDLGQYSAGNDYTQSGSPANKDNPGKYTGGVDKELDEVVLGQLDACFAAAEAQGVQVIPRFAYTWSDAVGCEPSEFEMIERHIEQISEVINKYKDTVISVECGIIGPWGEMHSSIYNASNAHLYNPDIDKDNRKEYERRVMAAYLNNLDETVTLQVRAAGFIVEYHGRNIDTKFMKSLPIKEDDPLYRVGMYNDGYLGTSSDYGTWSGEVNLNRNQGITFLKDQNTRIPYGGEMAYCGLEEMQNWGSPIWNDDFVKELYDTHLSYLDNISSSSHTIANELGKITFSDNHDFEGMPDVSEYYGTTLQKFMLDHMGYRFVMRSAETTGTVNPGEIVKLRGSVENTGFGNLLAGMVGEVIIVDPEGNYTPVSIDVDPQTWYTCQTTKYNISLSVPKDSVAGEYNVFMRFSSKPLAESLSTSATIRFANEQPVDNDFGGNYIGSFTVTEDATGVATDFEQISSFKDVSASHWADNYIGQICSLGLMDGVGGGKFSPETVATRAQFVTILYRMEGSPDASKISTPLKDISGQWYTDAVKWAYSEGIVKGTTPATFSPNVKLNRETFATMLYRYAEYKGIDVKSVSGDLSKFKDANKVSSWALEALKWANAEGYITGMTPTTIVPKGNATRAQMATILVRYIANTVD